MQEKVFGREPDVTGSSQKKAWLCIMAASKRTKQVKQAKVPKGKSISQGGDPEQYYSQNPAWTFNNADRERWAFSQEHIGDLIWSDIIQKLQWLESQTWSEILVRDKKKNHSIDSSKLNKLAQDRLVEKYIEAESLISLHIEGTHRLYGYMTGRVFNILWYDDDHGNNDHCVCRSRLKHT